MPPPLVLPFTTRRRGGRCEVHLETAQHTRQLTRALPGITVCHELLSTRTRQFDGLQGGHGEVGFKG